VLENGDNHLFQNVREPIKARLKRMSAKRRDKLKVGWLVSSTNKPDAQLFKQERHY
jgi:hypothetical protein